MYHNFFIHSSVNGHLGCFHVLAVVNSGAVNSGILASFSILVSSGYMSRTRTAGSHGGFILLLFLSFASLHLKNAGSLEEAVSKT